MRHARINGTVRVLFKTRLIFPRINGPDVVLAVMATDALEAKRLNTRFSAKRPRQEKLRKPFMA